MARPLRCEPLEVRTVPAALTVLVPDGVGADAGSAAGMHDLAVAVAARTSRPTDVPVVNYDAATDTLSGQAANTDVVVLQWAGTPNTVAGRDAAGAKLAAYLRTLLPADGRLDLHFIGHGTGAGVAVATIKGLAADDAHVGLLQLTGLNPLPPEDVYGDLTDTPPPLTVSDPDGPMVLPSPAPAFAAPTLAVPYNVDLADNYVVAGGMRFAAGTPVAEIDLTDTLASWEGRSHNDGHLEVRDWYLWTVDVSAALNAPPYTDPAVIAQRAALADPAARAALFSQQLDLDADGTPDDLGLGANVGFGLSVQTRFEPVARPMIYTGLDFVFVIDTTGSMFDDIDAVKARAGEILQALAQSQDVRVGVVVYRDLDDGEHGSPGDYQSQVLAGFTTDFAAVNAAIQGIEVGGGADWAESVFAGLAAAIEPGAELGAWRERAQKSVLLLGDAPPHMTEPGTGFTYLSTLLRADRAGVNVSAVATTASSDAWHLFKSVTQLTGGEFFYTGEAPSPGGEYGGGMVWTGGPMMPIDFVAYDGIAMPAMAAPVSGASAGGYAAAAADRVLDAVRSITGGVGTTPDGGLTLDPNWFNTVTRTAADFTGDGVADAVTGTGPGVASRVAVRDGATGRELFAVEPFEASFLGGVNVAAGDVTGDGVPDLVVCADNGGGPRVRVFDGATFAQVADFFGIDDPDFRGGARASVGDVNGDGAPDLVVAAGFGGGPRVAVYDGRGLGGDRRKLAGDFFAFEPGVRDGVYVSVGDLDADGRADVLCGGGPGAGPRVTAFSGAGLSKGERTVVSDFFAGDTTSREGVRVALSDVNGDGTADLVAAAGETVRVYDGTRVGDADPVALAEV